MNRPVRYNVEKGYHEILEGGKRWRRAARYTCDSCHKEFWRAAQKRDRGKLVFCSLTCSQRHNMQLRFMKQGWGSVAKWCIICGRRFMVKKSKYAKYTTCARQECRLAYLRQRGKEQARKRREAIHDRPGSPGE